MRRHSTLALAALVTLSLAIPTSAHALTVVEPGIAVAPAAHETPAPDISLADDGRGLVVWTGDNPASDVRCLGNGANCVIMARLMNADGTFDGDAFPIAADVPIDYYFAPASAAWNSTANEWLVTFTNYSVTPHAVYAQRVSPEGTLLGARRVLPTQQVTPADDRTTGGTMSGTYSNLVNATASWSAEHSAYLVTWWGNGDSAFVETFGVGAATFGIFLNADLTSADDLEAAFVLSDDGVGATHRQGYTADTAYDPTTGTWLTTWAAAGSDERTGAHVTLEPSISVGVPFAISSTSGWGFRITGGSTVWVPALDSYIVTWTGRPGGGTNDVAIWGRTVNGSTLGPVTKLSALVDADFGNMLTTGAVMRRSSVAVNGATLQIATHIEYSNYYQALTWSVDVATLTPSPAVIVLRGETNGESARPRVDAGGSGYRVVWQDWPNGDYSDGGEVRVTADVLAGAAPEEPELAETGFAELGSMAAIAALLLALGAAIVSARRPRRMQL